ncbi:MAG TPA: integrase core domain-containing protein [Candidatus Tectomicrobia bacterium]|jgi:putative transposase|nr:integrase core domain-containing protein [Candidatus Tectomicrobia bacterium]
MFPIISVLLAFIASLVRSRASLCLEHLALRHQLAVYQQTIYRPRLRSTDRVLWAWLARLWPGWREALAFVQPCTVIAWQRQRFRDYWRHLSQQGTPGRPAVAQEVRALIQAMWQANPTWGSPRIVGELRKLGLDVAKLTVETYRVRPRQPPSPTWKTFLHNHVQDLIALDFFVVPTVTHTVLFVLLILAHDRRRVVHFNITEHPTAQWTAQQVVDAFPWDEAPRYLLHDRDRIYGASFRQRVRHMGIAEVVIAPKSPWQNPYVERLIGSIRRECLDHVIVLHERHLRRLLTDYFRYYHDWRTHRALDMDCPLPRSVQRPEIGQIWEVPEVRGLHHHYERRAA